MGSKCIFNIYIVLFLSLLSNCGDRNTNNDKEKMVECRLYWISDTYPKETDNTKSTDMRFIRLHYLIINNMKYEVFLPIEGLIHSEGDITICSKMCAYINNRPIYTWFSTDTRWKGVLKPNDSIHAELKIPEWILDSAKVNKKIDLLELIKVFEVRYNRCLSDTIYSSLPISQLYFTYNDTLAIHYKDKNEGLKTPNHRDRFLILNLPEREKELNHDE